MKTSINNDINYLRKLFPTPTAKQRLLMKLSGLKDVPIFFVLHNDRKYLDSLLRTRRITITKGKINLTALGKKIAMGIKQVYGEIY